MTRLLVCGGRDYADREFVFQCLDRVHAKRTVMLLIHGAAKGADSLAAEWAKERGIEALPFPVTAEDWNRHGRNAGPMRNQTMLDKGTPEAVVAFPGGRGTAHMVRIAEQAGLPVWQPTRHPRSAGERG